MVHTRDVIKVLFDTRPICQTEERDGLASPGLLVCIMTHRTARMKSQLMRRVPGEAKSPLPAWPRRQPTDSHPPVCC